MIEQEQSPEMVDDILDSCSLKSGGAYTTVGTYDHTELLQIVNALSQKTGKSSQELIKQYGQHLFFRFYEIMPGFFEAPQSTFDFLESVHSYIHVEVKKLYPDASLPNFETDRQDSKKMMMIYTSKCPFADFAEGLMLGCIAFYEEEIKIDKEDRNTKSEYCRVFTLTKQGEK
jgi:hypothetical protein